ncbi:unnamed protein product [Rotaria sordida]|uniref:Protein kinase domain-containing protein n=2 Tax=Rotaria sordida TaxID=392033 RepID=A0A818WSN3_9BILA|nr:unnamed protein product [Rotaria sordida]
MTSTSYKQDKWYTTSCSHCTFTLPLRYKDLVLIEKKTYTTIVRATDTTTGKYVAIKKLLCPFRTHIYAKRTHLELKLLIYLNHHDAQFIHSAGIILWDLKPTNIGVDRNNNVTILDFGLARVAPIGSDIDYSPTRLWRAPEIYLNKKKCDEKIDIWSVGCIMAELILLKPLFSGKVTINQLNRIFDIIGTPDSKTLQEICIPEASAYISRMRPKPKTNFNELFGFKYDPLTETSISGVSPEGVDLLDQLLSFDPRQRPTVEQALSHPFLEFYHDPNDEPTIEPLIDEHEDAVCSKEQWKATIWRMIEGFIPPSWINNDTTDNS